MSQISSINLRKWFGVSQADKIVLTLAGTCFLPALVHSLPIPRAETFGSIWLPIFYAPTVAVLLFRPHVALVAGLLAPTLNYFLFGVPAVAMARLLTIELFLFSLILSFFVASQKISPWQTVFSYVLASAVGMALTGTAGHYFVWLLHSIPGLIVLGFLTFFITRRKEGLA